MRGIGRPSRRAIEPSAFRRAGRGLVLLALLLGCRGANTSAERITLAPGTTFGGVTDSLQRHGVITSRRAFRALARLRGVDRSVHAGVYEFPPAVPLWTVLTLLKRGKTVPLRFTIPEGLSIPEVAALAEDRLGIPADSVLAAARDPATAVEILGYPVATFEGFLRPETYALPYGVKAADLVRILVEGFTQAWEPAWDARLDSLGLSQVQLVTLASIVEGEARADDERETIAGVYHNRLRIGMALQADPTVQYAILLATGKRKTRLFEKDYLVPSPYNTYLHPGLPPGPVNSPSRRSIQAALYPAPVPYLYFVAGPDGRHLFSRTYSEHLRNVARARRLR